MFDRLIGYARRLLGVISWLHLKGNTMYIYMLLCIFQRPKSYENDQGWLKTSDGVIEPVWSLGPVLPTTLVDILDDDDCDPINQRLFEATEDDMEVEDDFTFEEEED